ncbi:glycosyltransferase [Salipiger bermudensis]|uniref:glycosyltransferase n=1 Tax=Salipiger bermudensis TaxID=344736 RepID=UPI001CD56051|nr:glycosyltransferase [Salipiger bermudensis]MCA0960563.1 glycosyltransferase [Salipiger bermudensis]
MRIALISHIRHPIAPPFMGGMEAHSHALAADLAGRGHDVTLYAAGDSRPPNGVRLRPIVAEHYDRVYPWHKFHGTDALNAHLDQAFASILPELAEGRYDILHNNSLHRYPPRLARQLGVPMLTSLHVPPFEALRRAVHASGAPWCRFTVCSEHQRQLWSDGAGDRFTHVAPNGIDPDLWQFRAEGDGSAVWFGRITPNKGTGDAVQALRQAGVPLRIFGPIEHEDYFNEAVRPWLGDRISYGGNLAPRDLALEVGRASVALFTPCWDEPFGLAAVEAMSCGVPVAAYDRGAVSEVVTDGCGVLAERNDVPGLASAVLQARGLDRRRVRDLVVRRFALRHMVDCYEELYRLCQAGRADRADEVRFAPWELPDIGLVGGSATESGVGADGIPLTASETASPLTTEMRSV